MFNMLKVAWKEVVNVARIVSRKDRQIGVKLPMNLWTLIQRDAQRSGWTMSEQIRAELSERRGLWKPPYLPHEGTRKPIVSSPPGQGR